MPYKPKEKKVKEKTVENELLEAMSEVVKTVKSLSDRVEKLETPITPRVILDEVPEPDSTSDMPVPSEYRMIVDKKLNKKFNIEVNASPNLPVFDFTIIVPKEYSNVPADEAISEDRRSKVITYAEGVEGVKLWIDKVYDNFSNETKAQITQDR